MMILIGVIAGLAVFGAIFGAMAYCAQDRLTMLSTFLKENEQVDEQVRDVNLFWIEKAVMVQTINFWFVFIR